MRPVSPRSLANSLTGSAAPLRRVTKPVSFRSADGGSSLMLNVDVTASAQLLVEMRDEHGAAIPGRALSDCVPVSDNRLASAVQWRAAASVPASVSYTHLTLPTTA